MAPGSEETAPEQPEGHAAERLRDFMERRMPGGATPGEGAAEQPSDAQSGTSQDAAIQQAEMRLVKLESLVQKLLEAQQRHEKQLEELAEAQQRIEALLKKAGSAK